ncbi:hypothetical protein BDP27DRAFT_1336418 [Rhodocollybia butyracea]|uniref:Uncharacterized protein n=1 Tax=Rhodocollybia butyracea TaxID=206335 RepID=A0A9P5U1P5_9AGAR|nr:hypothetical protein BDP27DRAFT_1336418 [Rhodocollybia butyracea]
MKFVLLSLPCTAVMAYPSLKNKGERLFNDKSIQFSASGYSTLAILPITEDKHSKSQSSHQSCAETCEFKAFTFELGRAN